MRKIRNGSASFILKNFSHSPISTMKCLFIHVAEKQNSSKITLFNKINTVSENSGHG